MLRLIFELPAPASEWTWVSLLELVADMDFGITASASEVVERFWPLLATFHLQYWFSLGVNSEHHQHYAGTMRIEVATKRVQDAEDNGDANFLMVPKPWADAVRVVHKHGYDSVTLERVPWEKVNPKQPHNLLTHLDPREDFMLVGHK